MMQALRGRTIILPPPGTRPIKTPKKPNAVKVRSPDQQWSVVTSEMAEAGAEVIWTAFADVLPWGAAMGPDLAVRVYRAMAIAANRRRS